jgi:hypothetical protein
VVHTIAVLWLGVLTATGTPLKDIGGWVACPAQVIRLGEGEGRRRRARHCGFFWRAGGVWLRRSWMVAAVRSEALMALVSLTGHQEWEWVCLLPWVAWLWKGLGAAWPGLGRQPLYEGMGRMWEQASGVTLVGLGIVWLAERLPTFGEYSVGVLPLGPQ